MKMLIAKLMTRVQFFGSSWRKERADSSQFSDFTQGTPKFLLRKKKIDYFRFIFVLCFKEVKIYPGEEGSDLFENVVCLWRKVFHPNCSPKAPTVSEVALSCGRSM